MTYFKNRNSPASAKEPQVFLQLLLLPSLHASNFKTKQQNGHSVRKPCSTLICEHRWGKQFEGQENQPPRVDCLRGACLYKAQQQRVCPWLRLASVIYA